MPSNAMNPELAQAIVASSGRLGVSPVDLATIMSYETGGRYDPNLWGGKNKNYLGLIQFGPEERNKYGVKPGMTVGDQTVAAENFLRDRGAKPNMGLLDLYSIVNAGAPGLYNRSDAANGGMPGTVADKVATQMHSHRQNALRLLGDQAGALPSTMPTAAAPQTASVAPTAPFTAAPASQPAQTPAPEDNSLMASLMGIQALLAPKQTDYAPAPMAAPVKSNPYRDALIAAALKPQGAV